MQSTNPKVNPHRRPVSNNFEAFASIEALSLHFSIEAPALKWTHTRRGHYTFQHHKPPEASTIKLGPGCWRGIEAALVHEFAHHLDFSRRGHSDHSAPFQAALVEVVQAWYGRQDLYPWAQEYKTVQAAGPRPKLDIDNILR